MTIQVTGILRDPTGTPLPNKEIRVIATQGSLLVLSDAHAVEITDENGLYDFPLEDGTYIIDVVYDDEAMIAGSSIVNMGTPTPVTLSELFLYTTPLDPQQVIDLQLEFQQLIDDLENAFDTETQEIRQQLVDGDASTLQTAQTFTNDRLGAEMAVITAQVTAGDASVLNQSRAYTDTAGNLLAADITQVAADTASVTVAFEASRDAQGVENASIYNAITAGIVTAVITAEATSNVNTGDLQVLLTALLQAGDATVLQQSGINAQSLNDATEAFLLDQLIISGQGSVAGYEAYTLAALGYFDAPSGLWVDGPLSASFRAHTIGTGDGQFASITDAMTTFAAPDGTLVAKGSLISDVNGRIAGYRHSNDGTTTDFEIIADLFSIGHMDGATYVKDLSYNTVTKLLEMSGNAIIDGTLSANKLIADSINANHIQADSITSNEILAGSITGNEINALATIIAGSEYLDTNERQLLVEDYWHNEGRLWGFFWSYDDGQFGSLDDLDAFGTTIKDVYTQDADIGGWGTRVIFNDAVVRDYGVPLIILINGIEFDMGFTQGTNTHFYSAINILSQFEGETVTFQLKEIDTGVFLNPLIAGMNGLNDGTGEGVDGLSFWAGIDVDNAHLAPYRVTNAGALHALDAHIEGTINASTINGAAINGGVITGAVIEGSTIIGTQFLYFCDPYSDGTKFYYNDNPTVALQCVQTIEQTQSFSTNPWSAGGGGWDNPFGPSGVSVFKVDMRSASDVTGPINTFRARHLKVKANWLTMNYTLNSSSGQGNSFLYFRVVFRNTITGAREESAYAQFSLGSTNGIGTGSHNVYVGGFTFTFHTAIHSFYGHMTCSAGSLGSATAPVEVFLEYYGFHGSVSRYSPMNIITDVDNSVIIP